MNSKEYIESGVLELYVAGTLSESEKKEVELMAAQHAEVRKEIEEIERAFEAYAMAHARPLRKEVIDNILTDIQENKIENKPVSKVIPMKVDKQEVSPILRYMAYAATILLLVSAGINIYYYNSYTRVKGELSIAQNDNLELAKQYNTVNANYEQFATVVSSPSYVPVTLKGQPIQPDAIAVVYWNHQSGDVYINATNLPAPGAGQQYQLWALKDGKPIDAGVFDLNGKMQPMKNISQADMFAVTLEPTGGSLAPTLSKLYVIGNV